MHRYARAVSPKQSLGLFGDEGADGDDEVGAFHQIGLLAAFLVGSDGVAVAGSGALLRRGVHHVHDLGVGVVLVAKLPGYVAGEAGVADHQVDAVRQPLWREQHVLLGLELVFFALRVVGPWAGVGGVADLQSGHAGVGHLFG